ncbi:hypothetical protein J2T60_001623 [Natronospira proteinivora]|uniref:Uncharacterized protein n=1 Tax=Natronospira proteinivora TaxID=1807133 RepID=A0ABT1GBA4_9GAMM|nr:hypothetical protein [Natronospira proteinivora]MCP1727623.1 hypothetical protein [Natronospira proteinivora]
MKTSHTNQIEVLVHSLRTLCGLSSRQLGRADERIRCRKIKEGVSWLHDLTTSGTILAILLRLARAKGPDEAIWQVRCLFNGPRCKDSEPVKQAIENSNRFWGWSPPDQPLCYILDIELFHACRELPATQDFVDLLENTASPRHAAMLASWILTAPAQSLNQTPAVRLFGKIVRRFGDDRMCPAQLAAAQRDWSQATLFEADHFRMIQRIYQTIEKLEDPELMHGFSKISRQIPQPETRYETILKLPGITDLTRRRELMRFAAQLKSNNRSLRQKAIRNALKPQLGVD